MNRLSLPSPESLPPLVEDEFLPPIQPWLLRGVWLVVGLVVSGVGMASVIPYNVTVQAIATVRPVAEVSVVQASTGGTLRRILVKENQPVKQGDVLAELGVMDPAQLLRLRTRRQRLQTYLQQYQTQLDQVNAQLQTLQTQIVAAADFLPTAPAAAVTDLDVEAALQRLSTQDSSDVNRWLTQRDRLRQQQASLTRQIGYDQTTLQAIDQELSKVVILVPADGTLFRLELRNPGQTIRAGDVVAHIVPTQTPVTLKARVSVQDISQVAVGQTAQLQISAYPYPDYGVLTGIVEAIAPDVVSVGTPTTGMAASYYEVTIQPTQSYLVKGDRQYPLQPGMEARADIISHQETLMQSLLRNLRLWVEA